METLIEYVEIALTQLEGKAYLSDIYLRVKNISKHDFSEELIIETLRNNSTSFVDYGETVWRLFRRCISSLTDEQITWFDKRFEWIKLTEEWIEDEEKSPIKDDLNIQQLNKIRKKYLNAIAEEYGLMKLEEYKKYIMSLLEYDKGLKSKEIRVAKLIQLKNTLAVNKLSKEIPAHKSVHNVPKSQGKYTDCENCGIKLNVKNIKSHQKKCKSNNRSGYPLKKSG